MRTRFVPLSTPLSSLPSSRKSLPRCTNECPPCCIYAAVSNYGHRSECRCLFCDGATAKIDAACTSPPPPAPSGCPAEYPTYAGGGIGANVCEYCYNLGTLTWEEEAAMVNGYLPRPPPPPPGQHSGLAPSAGICFPDQAAISGCNSFMYGWGYSISTSGLISCSGSISGSGSGLGSGSGSGVDPCHASCPVGCDGPADASKPQCAECAACRSSESDPCDACCLGTCDGPQDASKPQCADCAACKNDPAPTRSCPENEDSAAASLGTGALGTTLLVTATTALVLRKW